MTAEISNAVPTELASTKKPLKSYSKLTLEKEISQSGKTLVIYSNKVYDLTAFRRFHPGGEMALVHYNGRDATDVINAFHPQLDLIKKKLKYMYVGEFHCSVEDDLITELVAIKKGSNPQRRHVDPAATTKIALEKEAASDETMSDGSETRVEDIATDGFSEKSGETFGVIPPLTVAGGLNDHRETSASYKLGLRRHLIPSESPLAAAYRDLHEQLKADGFYEPNYWFYIRRAFLFLCTLSSAIGLVVYHGDNVGYLMVSALLMAFTWHGLAFSVHDAGHHSVTCDRKTDDYIGMICASYIGGLSVGWWRHNHNTHHIVTNDPEHDPDIQHLPFFAITTKLFSDLFSTYHQRVMKFDAFAKFCVSLQHYLFIPVLTFGRFNLYANSLTFLLNFREKDGRQYRWFELTGILFFISWFFVGLVGFGIPTWPLRLLYIYVAHAATIFLHLQITLSHFAMSTEAEDDDELFAVKALRTTMNGSFSNRPSSFILDCILVFSGLS